MQYELTEVQRGVQAKARQVAREKVAPGADQREEQEEYPRDLVELFAREGFFSLGVPQEYGGGSLGVLAQCLMVEEVSQVCNNASAILTLVSLGAVPIKLMGSEEQKQRYLPRIARGEALSAFGLTEPGAGSDSLSMQTRAVAEGEGYVVNGQKCFISQADVAHLLILFARTSDGKGTRDISAFVAELDPDKGTPGYQVVRAERKMSMRAVHTCQLALDDLRLPASAILGGEGQGFYLAMKTLDESRLPVAAQAVGIAQGALDIAVDYARQRVQFGSPISAFQGIQFMIADMATQVEAARQLTYMAAAHYDKGGSQVTMYSSMAKLLASDTAMKVATDAVQVLGGYGFTRDFPVERLMRDAKATQLYEGTNQIQRIIIARRYMGRRG
ncbi:MAG: acyl-CoA dehydrogenase family protein [Dehalococcoidia bacterium]